MHRSSRFVRPRVIASIALTAGLLILVHTAARACPCDCTYARDCGLRGWCAAYGSCMAQPPRDGVCAAWHLPGVDQDAYAATLSHWLEAYEVAGEHGGGPPDPLLVSHAQAASASLPAQNAEDLRQLAIFVQSVYLGLSGEGGAFTPPMGPASCGDPFPSGDNGLVGPLDPCTLSVAELIRVGLNSEITSPNVGNFQDVMAAIPLACMTYAPVGRCAFPQPGSPYSSGLDCLTGELFKSLGSLCGNLSGEGVLRVGHTPSGITQISWQGGRPGVFDLVRGDLSTLRSTAGDFTQALNAVFPGSAVCMAEDAFYNSIVGDALLPPAGGGYVYLLSPVDGCIAEGGYDSGSYRQAGYRDIEILGSPFACHQDKVRCRKTRETTVEFPPEGKSGEGCSLEEATENARDKAGTDLCVGNKDPLCQGSCAGTKVCTKRTKIPAAGPDCTHSTDTSCVPSGRRYTCKLGVSDQPAGQRPKGDCLCECR